MHVLTNLAATLSDLGRYDEGERRAAEAARLHPKDAPAARRHAHLLMQQGRHSQALREARRAASLEAEAKEHEHETHALLAQVPHLTPALALTLHPQTKPCPHTRTLWC